MDLLFIVSMSVQPPKERQELMCSTNLVKRGVNGGQAPPYSTRALGGGMVTLLKPTVTHKGGGGVPETFKG